MPPDLTIALAVHIVGGVGLIPHKPSTPRLSHSGWRLIHMQLETSPAALSAYSAISRAVSTLVERNQLAYAPWNHGEHTCGEHGGYVLTAAGLKNGLPHELMLPDLPRRVWLTDNFDDSRQNSAYNDHPEWILNDFLPSPKFRSAPVP
jgi:hypothetical protein